MTAVDRCPQCWCANCAGLLSEHTEAGCTCEDCTLFPQDACSLVKFMPPERISFFAQQLAPLLSSHLNPKAARRCLAVAHAAHHALDDYDNPKDADHA